MGCRFKIQLWNPKKVKKKYYCSIAYKCKNESCREFVIVDAFTKRMQTSNRVKYLPRVLVTFAFSQASLPDSINIEAAIDRTDCLVLFPMSRQVYFLFKRLVQIRENSKISSVKFQPIETYIYLVFNKIFNSLFI